MEREAVDVVVVGGGQAGIGAAYHIAQAGLGLVVLERGRVGETWRSQRWDSFVLNTPNFINGLPGAGYDGPDPDGFMTHTELVESFEDYVARFDLPVHTGVNVTHVRRGFDKGFVVKGETADGQTVEYAAGSVVAASGILQSPRIPAVASKLPESIVQLHTGTYRAPEQLPDGAVVVVGGGQSGAQIVEDLLGAGRTVYFAISRAPRVPRNYRGRDFMDWWLDMGIWDFDVDDVDDPAVLKATNPLVSGVGPLGHSISFQQLARDGARLMGRLQDVRGSELLTDDRVVEYIRNADEFSQDLRTRIDAFIVEQGLEAPEPKPDPGDEALRDDADMEFRTQLDLDEAGVGTVIWSTGFTADFSWIDLPVLDDVGAPVHHKGVADVQGIYFIGFPWLSKRKSGVVLGVDDDARHITNTILQRAGRPRR